MIRNLNFAAPPTYWTGEKIEPGDWARSLVPTFGGIWHHGVIRRVFWNGERHCVEVVHNVKNGGVIVSSLEDFAVGPVWLVRRPSSTEHQQMVLATAEANLSRPYSVLFHNCEHFCSFCYTWQSKSESIEGAMKLVLGLGAVALIAHAASSD